MNVYIIGVGPGNGRYLIKESEEKIENADIIIGACLLYTSDAADD